MSGCQGVQTDSYGLPSFVWPTPVIFICPRRSQHISLTLEQLFDTDEPAGHSHTNHTHNHCHCYDWHRQFDFIHQQHNAYFSPSYAPGITYPLHLPAPSQTSNGGSRHDTRSHVITTTTSTNTIRPRAIVNNANSADTANERSTGNYFWSTAHTNVIYPVKLAK